MQRLLGALLALAVLLPAAPARADGDPASDILLADDVFEPYAPKLSAPVRRALDDAVAAAKAAGFPVKVALIQEQSDLGAYPMLFGRPQRYADLLAVELSLNRKPLILTVMPSGFGAQGLGAPATAALRGVPIVTADRSDGLALAAARALDRAAAAAGHPFLLAALPEPARGAPSRGRPAAVTALLYLAPLLLLAVLGAGVTLRGRRRG